MAKVHSTNYENALILPSEDCRAGSSEAPAKQGTVAGAQFAALYDAPYTMTSDDLLVHVTGTRRDIPRDEWNDLRAVLFSKGQPCLRASPLVKTHGWAIHHDAQGRVALVARGSEAWDRLQADPSVKKISGMRSKRA